MLIDLHLHSEYSHDSTASVEDMLDEAAYRGYSAVAFAEHVSRDFMAPIAAYEKASSCESTILVYPAAELTLRITNGKKNRGFHCVVYSDVESLEQLCRSNPESLEEIEALGLNGVFKLLAHPIKKQLLKISSFVPCFDGVEFSNVMFSLRNNPEYYSDKDLGVVILNSDAHYPQHMGCCTEVKCVYGEDIFKTLSSENIIGIRSLDSKKRSWEDFDPLRI